MKNIIIAINPLKDKDNEILHLVIKKVEKVFKDAKIVVLIVIKFRYDFKEKIDIIMVLGGDGTLLGVARELIGRINAPIFGINIGNLGFLSSVEISGLDMAMNKLKNGKYKIVNRMMLKCKLAIKEIKNRLNALNDVVLARGTLSRMVKFQVFVDGKRYYYI